MSEGQNKKQFEMAVGTSNMLGSDSIEEENFYDPVQANELGNQSQNSWSKNDTGQLCRSCANSSDYLIPIYEGEGLEHQLEYKIQKHLPIQVSSTDTLPLQLCYQCASTLIAWDSLISSCLEAEKKLKAMQEAASQSKASEVYDDSHVGVTEMIDSDDEPLITSKTKLMTEKNKAAPIKKKILSKAKGKTIETLKDEKTASNSKEGGEEEEEEKQRSRSSDTEKNESSCEVFQKRKFSREMESISILSPKGTLKNIYRCKLCGYKTNRSNNLKTHLQIHKKVLIYKCEVCGKRYEKRQDGKEHLNNMEVVVKVDDSKHRKFYRCKVCGHTSNRSNNLKKHLNSHKQAESFVCSKCGGKCKEKDVRNYYVKEIEVVTSGGKGKKSFRCKVCGETFPRMLSLQSHITSHKPFSIYMCKICGRDYMGEKSLRDHCSSIHGEQMTSGFEFPYKCEYCDRLFTEKTVCEEHRKTHGGEKPYICHVCSCAFRTQSSLYIHFNIHGNKI